METNEYMDTLRFAVCVVFPETTASDVAHAAITHGVHVLDKEEYDPRKDYTNYEEIEIQNQSQNIIPLFVFPTTSVLAADENSWKEALSLIEDYREHVYQAEPRN